MGGLLSRPSVLGEGCIVSFPSTGRDDEVGNTSEICRGNPSVVARYWDDAEEEVPLVCSFSNS